VVASAGTWRGALCALVVRRSCRLLLRGAVVGGGAPALPKGACRCCCCCWLAPPHWLWSFTLRACEFMWLRT